MKKTILIIIIFLKTILLAAQPGGDGGLYIGDYFDEDLEPINIKDSMMIIRIFLMEDTSKNSKIIEEIYPRFKTSHPSRFIQSWFLGFRREGTNQRYFLVSQKDTMIIDFIGVIDGNGGGLTDRMDSLVFKKGYFKYIRNPNYLGFTYNDEDRQVLKIRNLNGLTPFSIRSLSPKRWIQFSTKIPNDFLKDENFLPVYFLSKSEHLIQGKKYIQTIKILNKFLLKKRSIKQKETATQHLYRSYLGIGDIDSAFYFLNKSRQFKNDGYYYQRRIILFLKQGKLDLALKDHNHIVKQSNNGREAKFNRAIFYMDHMNDYSKAIDDLKGIVNPISKNPWRGRYFGISDYNPIFFTLGQAFYHQGNFELAFDNFLLAQELGYGYTRSDYAITHYDTLTNKHPESGDLLLAKGIAHYSRAIFQGGKEKTKREYELALESYAKAESKGLSNYKVHYYRAKAYEGLKNYEKALKELNIAIFKNKKFPASYLTRLNLRQKLGEIITDRSKDKDWLLYQHWDNLWEFKH